jgi:hypothetical protein
MPSALCRPLRLLTLAAAVALAPAVRAADAPGPLDIGTEPLVSRDSAIGPIRYTPGRGLQLGDTGLHLGGYANVTLERDEGDPAVLDLEDLSLFVFWRLAPRLHLFSELEVENVVQIDDEGDIGTPEDRFTAERLYADVTLADPLTIRGGVFLTPVGRWNVIHAAPLVWTTSRPLTTERPFDTRSTGIMAYGSFFPDAGVLTYALYGQFADPIEGNPGFIPDDHSAGGRLEYAPGGALSVGASYRAAERRGRWRHLGGLDGLWQHDRLELQGEAVVVDGSGRSAAWGGYLQAAVELTPRVYLVERYEYYDAARDPATNLVSSGFLFRLLSNTVAKIEYLAVDTHTPATDPGFKVAVAMLF